VAVCRRVRLRTASGKIDGTHEAQVWDARNCRGLSRDSKRRTAGITKTARSAFRGPNRLLPRPLPGRVDGFEVEIVRTSGSWYFPVMMCPIGWDA